MDQRKKMLETAAAQVGYKEGRNNDSKFGLWYGMNNQPWCMMFISWCAEKAGIGRDIIPKMAYVPYAADFFHKRGLWHNKGNYMPVPGDLVFYGENDHIGIVEKVEKGRLETIEGNTSCKGNSSNGDGVYRRSRWLTDSWIKGFAHPEYKEDKVNIIKITITDIDRGIDLETDGFYCDGTNYIRLRDVEKLAPVVIGYDEKRRMPTVRINYPQAAENLG